MQETTSDVCKDCPIEDCLSRKVPQNQYVSERFKRLKRSFKSLVEGEETIKSPTDGDSKV